MPLPEPLTYVIICPHAPLFPRRISELGWMDGDEELPVHRHTIIGLWATGWECRRMGIEQEMSEDYLPSMAQLDENRQFMEFSIQRSYGNAVELAAWRRFWNRLLGGLVNRLTAPARRPATYSDWQRRIEAQEWREPEALFPGRGRRAAGASAVPARLLAQGHHRPLEYRALLEQARAGSHDEFLPRR